LRVALFSGSSRFEIASWAEIQPADDVQEFQGQGAALGFLRLLMDDPVNTTALREVFRQVAPGGTVVHRHTNQAIVDGLSRSLVTGQLGLIRIPVADVAIVPGEEVEKDEKPPPQEAPKKTTWIEIKLVDTKDRPLDGQRYRISPPGGAALREGVLDSKGFVRLDGLDPGTCAVSFPDA
jgi:hypothetical protein